ncbi:hypothetical protein ACFLTE_02560 [Bacteroidota bacterium]
MKKNIYYVLIAIIFQSFTLKVIADNDKVIIAFYNVEKLYDILDDIDNDNDDDYLPEGDKKWTEKRYLKKIDQLAKVISSIDEKNMPVIMGLSEIENKKVLDNIINNEKISSQKYKYIHEESQDEDGLDVALLYKTDQFRYINHKSIEINSSDIKVNSRDILYIKGIILPDDTVHVYVNHWKSRKGKDTKEIRESAAKNLKDEIENILAADKKAKIIVMGDFNDEPTDKSMYNILDANNKRKNTGKEELYNLFYDKHNVNDEGTYIRKDKWYMFDHIIVSQELVNEKKGLTTDFNGGKIFKPNWLLIDNPKADELIPSKTYGGDTYLGGISDHLPVYVIFQIK